jgi:hypothetical protein
MSYMGFWRRWTSLIHECIVRSKLVIFITTKNFCGGICTVRNKLIFKDKKLDWNTLFQLILHRLAL